MSDRDKIRKAIELTADIDKKGMVWGYDTEIAHIDTLIDQALALLEKPPTIPDYKKPQCHLQAETKEQLINLMEAHLEMLKNGKPDIVISFGSKARTSTESAIDEPIYTGQKKEEHKWVICRCIYDYMGISSIENENKEDFDADVAKGGEIAYLLGTIIKIDDKTIVRTELEGSKENLDYIEQLESDLAAAEEKIKKRDKAILGVIWGHGKTYEKLIERIKVALGSDFKEIVEKKDEQKD